MADYYAQFSEEIAVPADKHDAVDAFLVDYEQKLDSGELDIGGGITVTWDDPTQLWVYAEENFMDEELSYLMKGILRAIDDPEDRPVCVNVAYTCSKMEPAAFTGGCYAFWKDAEYYVDPSTAVTDYIKFHDGRPE